MRIVEPFLDLEIYRGHKLLKGNQYVMSGAVMNQLKNIFPGGIAESGDFKKHYRPINVNSLSKGKSLFLFRSGGIGDVMFMFPLIKYLKENFEATITVSTTPTYMTLIENNPDVDKSVKLPFRVEEMDEADYHLTFEGVIEDIDKEAKTIHAVDLFLKEAHVDFTKVAAKDKVPRFNINKSLKKRIWERIKHLKNTVKIGIQLAASSPIRTFPLEKLVGVARKMLSKGYAVFLFGAKREEDISRQVFNILVSSSDRMMVVNVIDEPVELDGSIVFASFMDVIVAPDSSFIHIAGALDIPVVGLYGCFPSLLRMRYYKNAIGIDANVPCAPSFIHGHAPCYKGDPPPCFSVISIDSVVNAVEHLLGNFRIEMEYPAYNIFKGGRMVGSTFVKQLEQ